MSTINIPVTFFVESCFRCGIMFAVTKDFNDECRRMGTSFYCPSGHSQSYGKSEAQQLREEKEKSALQFQARLNEATHARLVAENERDKEIKKRRAIERRIAKGVCPCCNRTFDDIARHMAVKHKDFALPPGHQKRIAGPVQ